MTLEAPASGAPASEAPASEASAPEAPEPADLTPQEAAQWARRAGLPLEGERLDAVTATANHIQAVVATLRELDFGDVPPTSAHTAELMDPEVSDATV
ncbi:hypothetical protein [Streptomyces alboflavus]|uniref:hypothetical protein n=1 Tax=Streptomyces alboflavus TaxID=67267 RepID=UPI0036A224EC